MRSVNLNRDNCGSLWILCSAAAVSPPGMPSTCKRSVNFFGNVSLDGFPFIPGLVRGGAYCVLAGRMRTAKSYLCGLFSLKPRCDNSAVNF